MARYDSATVFGFSSEEWQEMREEMRRTLAEVAREHRTISYGELVRRVSSGRLSARSAALTRLLGEVCEIEDHMRGTMLGSVVVRADTGEPGAGYFRHAAELGRDVKDPHAFWREEVERVWAVWERECRSGGKGAS